MKFFLSLIVLVLFISNTHNFVEKKRVYSEKVSSIDNTLESPLDAVSKDNLQTVNRDSSDGIPYKQKKRNRKGVKSALFSIASESDCRINKLDNKFILLTQVSYCFQAFSTNGKRGPPSGCFIS